MLISCDITVVRCEVANLFGSLQGRDELLIEPRPQLAGPAMVPTSEVAAHAVVEERRRQDCLRTYFGSVKSL